MGLDMYLYARESVIRNTYSRSEDGGWVDTPNAAFEAITDALNVKDIISNELFGAGYTVEIPLGYWRKANAIHGWIISESNATDDCSPIYLPKTTLSALLDICKAVKTAHTEEAALSLLPPTEGCFFGNQDIDEWYWQQIDYTIALLEKVLADDRFSDSIYYQSSW